MSTSSIESIYEDNTETTERLKVLLFLEKEYKKLRVTKKKIINKGNIKMKKNVYIVNSLRKSE